MPRFIVRVELYGGPSWQDYNHLHTAMERRGFVKTITSDKGVVYELPTATYYRDATVSLSEVLKDAKAAADGVWTSASAIAMETNGISWNGLRPFEKRRLA